MPLRTSRLALRDMDERDLPQLRAILQDERTMTAYEGAFDDAMATARFERMQQRYREDGVGTMAVCRSHVTGSGDAGTDHFACATFVHMHDGLIQQMTEVWTDVGQQAPPGSRPADSFL